MTFLASNDHRGHSSLPAFLRGPIRSVSTQHLTQCTRSRFQQALSHSDARAPSLQWPVPSLCSVDGLLAPTLGCFPQRIWVMTWTNNKMFVWTALLWKSCSGVLMIHPNYYHFSAKLANNKLSCLVLFIILMRRSPHLSQTTEEIKEWKEPNWGTQCDLSSKAKICPRKFQPKWESGTENTTCLRIGWLENICHLDKQWEKLNKKSAKRQERVKIWFNCFTCSSRHQ